VSSNLGIYNQLVHLNADSAPSDVVKAVVKFEKAFRRGQGDAGFILGCLFNPDNMMLSDTVKQEIGATHEKSRTYFKAAHSILMHEALAGNGRSMHMIAVYYQSGLPPVSYDSEQYEYWKNKALNAGYRGAGQL